LALPTRRAPRSDSARPHSATVFRALSDEHCHRLVDDAWDRGILQRMLTDRLDVVFIHDCDRYGHGERPPEVFDEAIAGAAKALVELRDQGVIGAVGMGVNEADVCVAAARRADFDVFLLAGRYTLLEQDPLDELLPLCDERRISLVLGGVFNSGILAAGAVPGTHHNYGEPPDDVARRVSALAACCARHDVPLAAAAVQFVHGHPAVACALIRSSTLEQQAADLAAATTPVPRRCGRSSAGTGWCAPTPRRPRAAQSPG
jgi:D-threo-aldose 1-dehydrogenase